MIVGRKIIDIHNEENMSWDVESNVKKKKKERTKNVSMYHQFYISKKKYMPKKIFFF